MYGEIISIHVECPCNLFRRASIVICSLVVAVNLWTVNSLLPLDSCRRLAGDIVDYSVYAADFVYYAVGYYAENLVRDS